MTVVVVAVCFRLDKILFDVDHTEMNKTQFLIVVIESSNIVCESYRRLAIN